MGWLNRHSQTQNYFFSAVSSEEFREEERCEQQFFVMSLEITDF